MKTLPCPWCLSRRRSFESWRDHVALNECGDVPPDQQIAVIVDHADTWTEGTFQRVIVPHFTGNGWSAYHADRGKGRDGQWLTNTTTAGLPDWLFVKPPIVFFVELKRQDNKRPTRDQVRTIKALQACTTVVAGFARPSDAAALYRMATHS